MFLAVTDQTFSSQPTLFIYNLADFPDDLLGQPNPNQETVPVREMFVPGSNVKMCGALWGSLNQTVIAAYDDGSVRVWDVDSGQEINRVQEHKKQINSIQFSKDHTMIITASSDHTAKIYDAKSLQLLKTFTSDRPLNSAAMSPLFNHVIVGGGQEAMNVTITSAKVGHFEVDFYHTVYGDFLGSVKGHFGPVNTVAFNTNGKSFASGAEDGYIRLHHVSHTPTSSPAPTPPPPPLPLPLHPPSQPVGFESRSRAFRWLSLTVFVVCTPYVRMCAVMQFDKEYFNSKNAW